MKFKRRQIEDKMGLDMYAYVATKAGQQDEFYEGAEWDKNLKESVNPNVVKPREIAYWRKHPNLQGWMQLLWESKGNTGIFNLEEVELTWKDLDRLEKDIKNGTLATQLETAGLKPYTGFFFGDPSDDRYRESDLQFCVDAKFEVFLGNRVFYYSSW